MKPTICLMSNIPFVPGDCKSFYWLIPVESLNEVEAPDYGHAYILPDNSVWVLNYTGNGFTEIANTGEGGQPTLISNEDGYITVSGSGTYEVVANLDTEKVTALIADEVEAATGAVLENIQSTIETIESQLDSKSSQEELDSLYDSLVNNYGGTNLLLGTKDFSGVDGDAYVTTDLYRGFSIAHVDRTTWADTSFYDGIGWSNSVTPEPDVWYTLSFWAKGTGSFQSYFFPDAVQQGLNSSGATTTSADGQIETTVTDEWQRYWVSWKTLPTLDGEKTVRPARVYGGNDLYICGIMFERGKFAHDWSPAPDDKANQADLDSLNDSLDNLFPGGTQILRNTNTGITLTTSGTWDTGAWLYSGVLANNVSIEITDAPNPDIKYGRRFSASDASLYHRQTGLPLLLGQEYTVSCYARVVSDSAQLRFTYGVVADTVSAFGATITNTEWKKYSFTFIAKETNTTLYMGKIASSTGALEMCGEKLELGNKATDWSLSPWDVTNRLTNLEAAVVALGGAI